MVSVSEPFILSAVKRLGVITMLNPNYAQEAKRTNALARILGLEIGFNPDLATLGFHQKGFHKTVKTLVLLSRCEAEKMLMHFLGKKIPKKNTRKARNTRNTYSQFLYPLVFFYLKKTKRRKRKIFQNTRNARNTRNTQDARLWVKSPMLLTLFICHVRRTPDPRG
jgi:hypothetical protein